MPRWPHASRVTSAGEAHRFITARRSNSRDRSALPRYAARLVFAGPVPSSTVRHSMPV